MQAQGGLMEMTNEWLFLPMTLTTTGWKMFVGVIVWARIGEVREGVFLDYFLYPFYECAYLIGQARSVNLKTKGLWCQYKKISKHFPTILSSMQIVPKVFWDNECQNKRFPFDVILDLIISLIVNIIQVH